jgi:hypothetical protein
MLSTTNYTLQIELGLVHQTLHNDLNRAAAIFSTNSFCGFDLDAKTQVSQNQINCVADDLDDANPEFHGFLKLEGCCITEASITVPFSKRSGSATKFAREDASPLVIPQLVSARHICHCSLQRLNSWLDPNGRLALDLDASIAELLELRREIEAARSQLLGRNLPLLGTRTVQSNKSRVTHPFHTSLPNNVRMEVGIVQAELCLFVWTLTPLPTLKPSKLVDNVLVHNMGVAMFRNFGGREDAELRNILSQYADKSNVPGIIVGNSHVVAQFSKCVCKMEPASRMLKLLNHAVAACDKISFTLTQLKLHSTILTYCK